MKKYVNPMPNGGLDFRNNDWLDCLQEEQYRALIALVTALGGTGNFIISGCLSSYTAPNLTVTSGYVYLDGDIHYFPGGTVATGAIGTNAYIVMDSPSWLARVFKNLVSNNAIKTTVTKLQLANVAGHSISVNGNSNTTLVNNFFTTFISILNSSSTTINAANILLTGIADCLAGVGVVDLDVVIGLIRAMLCNHETRITAAEGNITTLQTTVTNIQSGGTLGAWQNATALLQTNWSSIQTPEYFKGNGMVELRGRIKYTSGGNGNDITAFTLPVGYRPDVNLRFNVSFEISGAAITSFANSNTWTLEILTTGVVRLKLYVGSSTDITFDLASIYFRHA